MPILLKFHNFYINNFFYFRWLFSSQVSGSTKRYQKLKNGSLYSPWGGLSYRTRSLSAHFLSSAAPIVNPDNPKFSCDSNKRFLQDKLGKTAYAGYSNESVTIPAHIEILEAGLYRAIISIKSIKFTDGSNLKTLKTGCLIQLYLEEALILPPKLEIIESNFMSDSCPSISIPSSILSCSDSAFSTLNGLQEITISGDCTILHSSNGIIYNHNYSSILFIPPNFDSFNITKEVKTIPVSLIRQTKTLKSVNVDEGHENYAIYKGILYTKDFNTLLSSPYLLQHANVIDNCSELSSLAFSGTLIETVECTSVTKILGTCFYGCSALSTIQISPNLTTIGSYCFYGCSLVSISFSSSLENVSNHMLACNRQLITLDMSSCTKLYVIPIYMCASCILLQELKLPPNLENISSYSFSNCEKLSSIILFNVSKIGDNSFNGCKRLCNVTFSNGIKIIESGIFKNCNLTSIWIPKSVNALSDGCFENNSFLSEVEFEDNSELKTISSSIFSGCSSLLSLQLPGSIEHISPGALSKIRNLVHLTVKETPESFFCARENILYDKAIKTLILCPSGITNASIANGIESIAVQAFSHCSKFRTVQFPEVSQIKIIETSTFYNCSSLYSLTFPSSIEEVREQACDGCILLSEISFKSPSKLVRIDDSAFAGCSSLETFRIPTECLLLTIGNSAFAECRSLGYVDVPDSVERIGTSAYANCINIKSVRLGANLTSLGVNAFSGCSNISIIKYCGAFELKNVSFTKCQTNFVAVKINYGWNKVGGLDVFRTLDNNCAFPTVQFSNEGGRGPIGMISSFLMSMYNEDVD